MMCTFLLCIKIYDLFILNFGDFFMKLVKRMLTLLVCNLWLLSWN